MNSFISYSSEIKRTAGRIKSYLDRYGFNCFLAHEDIPPQTVWPEKILYALKKCDLFIPLLTEGFTNSFYCQQETGFAYCHKVEILPILISEKPMGMIANLQAIPFNKTEFDKSCWKIVEHVAHNAKLAAPILDAAIDIFGRSGTYNEACTWVETFLNKYEFTNRQIKEIKHHIKNNYQINESKKGREEIFKFMKNYPTIFNDKFIDWYDQQSRTHMRY
jgi:hypothetical protein